MPERVPRGHASLTLHGVLALLPAPKLAFVDLEGAQGLTDLMICALKTHRCASRKTEDSPEASCPRLPPEVTATPRV